MAQHDLIIDNAPGQPVRLDMQAALQALATCSSGAIEPGTPYPGMFWLDLSTGGDGILRQRNQANSGWVAPSLSTQLLPFVNPDMSILGRTSPNRIVVNDKVDGTGTDVMAITETGSLLIPPNAAQPVGSCVERLYTTGAAWTKPVGLKHIEVEGQAAGGGGGGAAPTNASQMSAGGGGGGGAWGRCIIQAATLPSSVTVTIGGIGIGNPGATGGNGGTTSFGSLVTFTGGYGGNSVIGTSTQSAMGSLGGTATGTGIPAANYGMSGDQGILFFSAAYPIRGRGADSLYGGGGRAQISAANNGENAFGFGAGGSGASNGMSQPNNRPGGQGAPGFIRVREYY